jgi:hypothetical protein
MWFPISQQDVGAVQLQERRVSPSPVSHIPFLYAFRCLTCPVSVRVWFHSKTWALYNYKHGVDLSLGLVDTLLHVLGPSAIAIPVGPQDPNVGDVAALCDTQVMMMMMIMIMIMIMVMIMMMIMG